MLKEATMARNLDVLVILRGCEHLIKNIFIPCVMDWGKL